MLSGDPIRGLRLQAAKFGGLRRIRYVGAHMCRVLTYPLSAALALLFSGCFIEASGGLYQPIGLSGAKPGYQYGVAAGLYIDPGPFRVAVGVGRDIAPINAPAGRATLGAGSYYARVDVNTPLDVAEDVPLRITAAALFDGEVVLRPSGSSEDVTLARSHAYSFFLGTTLAFHTGEYGIHLSLGPSFLYARTPFNGVNDYGEAGGQLRVALTWSGEAFLAALGASSGSAESDGSYNSGYSSSGSSNGSSNSYSNSSSNSSNTDYMQRQQQQNQDDYYRRQDQQREQQNSERIRNELRY